LRENIFLKKLFGTVCPTIKTPKPIMNNAIKASSFYEENF
jgi:hypothetical protein